MQNTITKKLDIFFSSYKIKSYPKGEIIVWANASPPGVIYLLEGNVGLYDIHSNGHKIMLNIFKPNAFFPMSWAINQTDNKYFYEALSNVQCQIAPPSEVMAFLKTNPEVGLDLLGRVYRGMDGILERVSELMAGTASSQLLLEILISTLRFGKINQDGSAELNIKTTELASQTGMARETISRELKKLEANNSISREGATIKIKNIDKLRNI